MDGWSFAPRHVADDLGEGHVYTRVDDAGDAYDPRGDIRLVQVSSAPAGGLVLTTHVEQYADPAVDPTWLDGSSAAFWPLDTSYDGKPDVVVELFSFQSTLFADVFDWESGAFICEAVPSTSALDRSYSVTIPLPGCLGDTRVLAFSATIGYGLDPFDHTTYSGRLVDTVAWEAMSFFARPPLSEPAGGYAVITRDAGFQRFGAVANGGTPAGTFEDYVGPGQVVGTAGGRVFDPGLWSVTDDGEVSTQDGGEYYGDMAGLPLARPVVGMAVLPDRSGYWLVASDGGIFAFGDAGFYGSTGALRLNRPIVGMAASPTGLGYWLVASDGGIFAFGDAEFRGSTGAMTLNKPVVGMAAWHGRNDPSASPSQGYWLVAADGGIFAFGLPFHGSTGALTLQQPIVGMAASRSGGGYRFIARDGGVFCFGDAEFVGSAAAAGRTDVVGLTTA